MAGWLGWREKVSGRSESELRLEEEEEGEGERQTEPVEHMLGMAVEKTVGGGDKEEGERE